MKHCEYCNYYYADEFNFGYCPNGCHDELTFNDEVADDV